jgi:glyoxylase-like metal-dependent hydrolase (beta-lactamase superfamily II)
MLTQLTNHIYFFPADASTDRPILAAILGRDHMLMIDAGNSPRHVDLFLHELAQITERKPDWVVLTHWHWDHTFGLSRLAVPAIGHKNLARNLARLQSFSWDDAALAKRVQEGEEIVFCAENIRKEYGTRRDIHIILPTLTFDTDLTIHLGGVTCELHAIPTAHTDDSIAVYVREDKTLFLGDALGENSYAPVPYYSAAKMKQLTAFIDAFDADWFVESHARPVSRADFWVDNEILTLVADAILGGITDKAAVAKYIQEHAVLPLPEDSMEVIDSFLNDPHRESPPIFRRFA